MPGTSSAAIFTTQIDGTDIDIRETQWGITLTLMRKTQAKCIELDRAQAAAIADGLVRVLTGQGTAKWPSNARSK
jgi:hypothetical protein